MAAPIFGAAGLVLGLGLWAFLGGILPLEMIAAAVIAALAAFQVFSSQSVQRPPSVWQASVADGVVAGVIAGSVSGIVISLITGSAGSGHSSASLGATFAAAALSALAGAAGGALCGYLTYLIGGPERLARAVSHSSRASARKRTRKRR